MPGLTDPVTLESLMKMLQTQGTAIPQQPPQQPGIYGMLGGQQEARPNSVMGMMGGGNKGGVK